MSWYSDGEKFDEYEDEYCKWHCPNGNEHDCDTCIVNQKREETEAEE